MNNKNIKTIIAAVAIFVSIGSIDRAAAQVSGNLGLSGDVATVLALGITPSGADSLAFDSGAVSNSTIASILEACNDADGYTVTVTSSNGQFQGANTGMLQGGSHSELLSYTISYADVGVTLTGGTATITNSNSKTSAGGVTKTVKITYDATSSNLAADTYTDTLTFTITAK